MTLFQPTVGHKIDKNGGQPGYVWDVSLLVLLGMSPLHTIIFNSNSILCPLLTRVTNQALPTLFPPTQMLIY